MDFLSALQSSISDRYAVIREIGVGGMATVYLARDVRHDRHVALKVLKPELGAVLGVERFLSEIRVTANLQHPNLLPLFDSGEAGGLLFYVMPFVEGESLRARLDREKQLPVDDALEIAIAVASALDYAHSHNVVHRDLKPENILMQHGQPVIADFGIALAVSNAGGARITQTGLSLGTPQYMSPEQATGDRMVDGRTDIYSLGAILYEMLTGEPPHTGNTVQAVIAKLLTDKPRSIRLARDSVSENIEFVVEKALAKLPADRWISARDFAQALREKNSAHTLSQPAAAAGRRRVLPSASAFAQLRFAPVTIAVGLALIAGLAVGLRLAGRGTPAQAETVRFELTFPVGQRPVETPAWPLAISPDGRTIVYAGEEGSKGSILYARDIDRLEIRTIDGTDKPMSPVFSPDGRTLLFFTADGQLKRVPVEGGPAITLAEGLVRNGLSWGSSGVIVIGAQPGRAAGLSRLPATGGTLEQFTRIDSAGGEMEHIWPVFLDDGKTILFTVGRGSGAGLDGNRLAITSLETGKVEQLDILGVLALGIIDQRLAYLRSDGVIMAVPFYRHTRKTTGPAVGLVEGIPISGNGNAKVFLGANGALVYMRGSTTGRLTWVDENGTANPITLDERRYDNPRLSPDGKRIAVSVRGANSIDIWIQDTDNGTFTRLTSHDRSYHPEWTPDGQKVLFRSGGDSSGMMLQPADGSRPAERLIAGTAADAMFSPEGGTLIYVLNHPDTKRDIWVKPISGNRTEQPWLVTPFNELNPRFSPDGKWVAYTSDQAVVGRMEVYVRPYPGPGAATLVSARGGSQPVWAEGGRLFYISGATLMRAKLTFGGGAPVVTSRDSLFQIGTALWNEAHARYDVASDGRRFLLAKASVESEAITVVLNWMKEVRQRTAIERQ